MIWPSPKGVLPRWSNLRMHAYILMATQTSAVLLGWQIATPALSSQSLAAPACAVGQSLPKPTQTGDVVVLGRSQGRRYVVIVPTDETALQDKTLLMTVRQCVPTAFVSNSRPGWFIYAGAYGQRGQAEGVAAALRSRGMDARVVYFR